MSQSALCVCEGAAKFLPPSLPPSLPYLQDKLFRFPYILDALFKTKHKNSTLQSSTYLCRWYGWILIVQKTITLTRHHLLISPIPKTGYKLKEEIILLISIPVVSVEWEGTPQMLRMASVPAFLIPAFSLVPGWLTLHHLVVNTLQETSSKWHQPLVHRSWTWVWGTATTQPILPALSCVSPAPACAVEVLLTAVVVAEKRWRNYMLESFSRTGNCDPNQFPAFSHQTMKYFMVSSSLKYFKWPPFKAARLTHAVYHPYLFALLVVQQTEQEQNWKGIQLLRTGYWKLLNSVECSNIIRIRLETGEIRRPKMRSLKWILKGVPNISFHLNLSLFDCVQSYILETNSFTS